MMPRKTNVAIISLVSFALMTACSKKSDSKSTEGPAPAPAPSGSDGGETSVTTIGTLALDPGDMFAAADQSVDSIGTGVTGLGGASGAGLVADGEGPWKCNTENTMPIDAKDDSKNDPQSKVMKTTDPVFPTARLYCTINGTANNSTTIKGAYHMPKVFGCALSSLAELEFDGVERDVKLPVTRACFGDLLDDPDTGIKEGDEVPVKVTMTKAPRTGWDFSINIVNEGSKYLMLFKGENKQNFAFAVYSSGQQDFGDDLISLSLDATKGELRYIYRRDITDCDGKTGADLATCYGASTDDQWQGTRHLAMLVKGEIDGEASFKSISDLDAMFADSSSSFSGSLSFSAQIDTIIGNLTTGVTQRTYSSQGKTNIVDLLTFANYAETTANLMCFKDEQTPVAGACTGNEGNKLDADADTVSIILPSDTRHPRHLELIEKILPAAFTSVDPANTEI